MVGEVDPLTGQIPPEQAMVVGSLPDKLEREALTEWRLIWSSTISTGLSRLGLL